MSDLVSRRMLKLVEERSPKRILIHRNANVNLKESLEREIDAEIKLTTSNLKYTGGINRRYSGNPDLVVFVFDAYDPIEVTKSIVNNYVRECPVILIGPKKSGVKRISKSFETEKKFYSDGFQISLLPQQSEIDSDIEETSFEVEVDGIKLKIEAQEGLFSYRRLDPGTRFLLENVDIEEKDSVLDFGCGYGVIGLYFAKRYPNANITMVDSDLKAIDFAKTNRKLNSIENVEIKPSYFLKNVTDEFDRVVSNPPTHTKKEEIADLISGFRKHLKSEGEVFLVVNKTLNYERFAEKYYNKVTTLKENDQYKILKFFT